VGRLARNGGRGLAGEGDRGQAHSGETVSTRTS
jgi:hypothetical protein